MEFQVIFFIFIAFIVIMSLFTFIKNENSPIISTRAQLIKKKRDLNTHTDGNGITMSDETLILVFELDTGSELRFNVGGRVFRGVPENELGTLTFQGTRFLKFESASGCIEK